jgi:hypothetical protein
MNNERFPSTIKFFFLHQASGKLIKIPGYYDLHTLMIMTYLAVLLYPFVYKAKTARHKNNLWKG